MGITITKKMLILMDKNAISLHYLHVLENLKLTAAARQSFCEQSPDPAYLPVSDLRKGDAKERQESEAGSDVMRASARACTYVRVRVRVRKPAASPRTAAARVA